MDYIFSMKIMLLFVVHLLFTSSAFRLSWIIDGNEDNMEFNDIKNCSPDSMECALDNNVEVSLGEVQDSAVMTNSETVMERPIKQEAEKMSIELLAARLALQIRPTHESFFVKKMNLSLECFLFTSSQFFLFVTY